MMEMLRRLDTGWCKNCREPIALTVGEWSPERWHHESNGRPECPGAPVAQPAKYVLTAIPSRNHSCPLPVPVVDGEVWRCPECTIPWQGEETGWYTLDWTYAGPTQPVRDEPQA